MHKALKSGTLNAAVEWAEKPIDDSCRKAVKQLEASQGAAKS
jgi:hypothetical protein